MCDGLSNPPQYSYQISVNLVIGDAQCPYSHPSESAVAIGVIVDSCEMRVAVYFDREPS